MTAAFRSLKEDGMPLLKASRVYHVPETTLRDRVLLKIDPDTCVMGKVPMFDQFQEAKIVEHFKNMAALIWIHATGVCGCCKYIWCPAWYTHQG
ncbi:hypothetical protein DPMN_109101 [Dreissena polymorpha]|uniref:HTH psq-type domain-containing protein n=1 Tax=Dreissena polymorpha TaxID=45954 RepID=A0A9D4QMN8_DREPO|nr:hypothetical protein DPMN_109101 [Dreissena polymorpha]